MPALLAALHDLEDRLTDLSQHERIILNIAAALAEELQRIETGSLPERITEILEEDYDYGLPEVWEWIEGRPLPKRWGAYMIGDANEPGVIG